MIGMTLLRGDIEISMNSKDSAVAILVVLTNELALLLLVVASEITTRRNPFRAVKSHRI